MSIVARWRRWWGLSRTDRSALLGMMLALPLLSAALRFFGYARVRRWIEDATNRNVRPACASDPAMEGERLARLAAIAGRHGPIRATCLRQSLLIYGLLRERGLSPELKIGVKGGDGLPDMHAWVDLEGTPLGEPALAHSAFELHNPLRTPEHFPVSRSNR